jgi:hypothetical protein
MDYLDSFNKVFNKTYKGYFMKREYKTPGPIPALKILTVELWFIGFKNKRKELVTKFEYKGTILNNMVSQVYEDLNSKVLMFLFENRDKLFAEYGKAE